MNALAQPVHHLRPDDFSDFPFLTLLNEVRTLMNQERAVQYRLAAVLRELDSRDSIDGTPLRLTRWLHDHFGLTFGVAREKVRTARALGSLPLIDAAFRDGDLSYSKVRALTRAATPDNEADLLERARHASAEGVEQLVRRVKQNECLDNVQAMIRSRALSTRWDESGMLIVQGRLTPEQGEVFLKALSKATETMREKAVAEEAIRDEAAREQAATETDLHWDAEEDTYWAQRADALTHLMSDSLTGTSTHSPGDRHQLMVHVSAETLAGHADGNQNDAKNVPAETFFHPETLRRLACDGGLVTVVEKANGDPLSIGRKTRVIPPSMRRALVARDRHCQYPGCSHELYVEGHHIVHWAQGGATRLDNLVLLCSRHHRQLHEFGERIQRGKDGIFHVAKSKVAKSPLLKTVYTDRL